jgi:hypothetical protein
MSIGTTTWLRRYLMDKERGSHLKSKRGVVYTGRYETGKRKPL